MYSLLPKTSSTGVSVIKKTKIAAQWNVYVCVFVYVCVGLVRLCQKEQTSAGAQKKNEMRAAGSHNEEDGRVDDTRAAPKGTRMKVKLSGFATYQFLHNQARRGVGDVGFAYFNI